MKRLASYATNLLDYHAILDLLPSLAALYFTQRLVDPSSLPSEPVAVRLSAVQSAILLVLGLQRRSIEAVEAELGLPVAQALALFVKAVRKLSKALEAPRAKVLGREVLPPGSAPVVRPPVAQPIAEELDEASRGLREAVDELDLAK
jgi:N-acetyltransferase 10